MTAREQLEGIARAIDAAGADPRAIAALARQGREAGALLDALPPRYRDVLLDLLDRLESSALFSEESCSFSQKGLLDGLRGWVEKARTRL